MISSPGQRPPYPGTAAGYSHAPNAALLIDFDNVTMGIRSDLGKELKSLLNSEVIRGKVAVQRAYADWRRYPQYIVPLAESSIDLIFAPAYGSAKKNATDLRMAIDAIELVFTRPEIGTYILMTGDSDFSSCVLKLKEYGKYVIGVGMRESSSDLLIQNCDEYYSYHSLSGLTRAGEVQESREDPWVLMKRAAQRMQANGDVMRTDRLKQVMLDLDPAFDEKKIGYSKFSRFVQEAATKGIVQLRKGENGQLEIVTTSDAGDTESATSAQAEVTATPTTDGRSGRGRERDRDGRRDGRRDSRLPRRESEPAPLDTAAPPAEISAEATVSAEAPAAAEAAPAASSAPVATPVERATAAVPGGEPGLDQAYRLLQAALRDIVGGSSKSVRDGDVKRRMLDMSPDFDESTLGFAKFTRFLRQAHDAEIVDLQRAGAGNYEVALPVSGKRLPAPSLPAAGAAPRVEAAAPREKAAASAPAARETIEAESTPGTAAASAAEAPAARAGGGVGGLRGRRGGRAGAGSGPPPILPGQAVAANAPVNEEPVVEAEAAVSAAPATPAPSSGAEAAASEEKKKSRRGRRGRGRGKNGEAAEVETPVAADAGVEEAPSRPESRPEPRAESSRPVIPEGPIDKITARARRGRALRGDADERATAPPILPGQAVKPPATAAPAEAAPAAKAVPAAGARPTRTRRGRGAQELAEPMPSKSNEGRTPMPEGLPVDREGVVAHLSAYKGVGVKSAETLFDAFGEKTFEALQSQRERVQELLGPRRSATVLNQWEADYADRLAAAAPAKAPEVAAKSEPEPESSAPKKPAGGGRGRSRAKAADTAPKKAATAASKRKAAPAARASTPAEPEAAPAKKPRASGGRGGRGRGGKASEPAS